MNILEKVPDRAELIEISPFDMAFLKASGKLKFVPTDHFTLEMLKSLKDFKLWGPEAKLLSVILRKTWISVGGVKFTEKLTKSFDLSGDITVDRQAVERLFLRNSEIGSKTWKKCAQAVFDLINRTVKRSHTHFNTQRLGASDELVKVSAEEYEAFLASANSDHIRAFIETYPETLLHPEVMRLVALAEINPSMRNIDKALLTDRIENISAKPTAYLDNMSDVQVGRAWNATGLYMAQAYNVTEYMIIAQDDGATCLVCRKLDGMHGSVTTALERVEHALSLTDPKEIAAAIPFIRFKDIDNIPIKDVEAIAGTPPYHGKCRCSAIFLWSRTEVMDEQIVTSDSLANSLVETALMQGALSTVRAVTTTSAFGATVPPVAGAILDIVSEE